MSYPNLQDFVSYTRGSLISDLLCLRKMLPWGGGSDWKIEKLKRMGNNRSRFGHHKTVIPVKTFYHTSLAKKTKFFITFLLSTTQQQSVHKGWVSRVTPIFEMGRVTPIFEKFNFQEMRQIWLFLSSGKCLGCPQFLKSVEWPRFLSLILQAPRDDPPASFDHPRPLGLGHLSICIVPFKLRT